MQRLYGYSDKKPSNGDTMFHSLTHDAYKKLPDYPTLTYGLATSPYGPIAIAWWPAKIATESDKICYLSSRGDLQRATEDLHDLFPNNPLHRDDKRAARFAKEFRLNNKTHPVLLKGSEFYVTVWKHLFKTKPGDTLTYGELAKRAGKPLASRAVGTAMRTNPIALLIPCHRVVASNGLGGYGFGGLAVKKRLLEEERML